MSMQVAVRQTVSGILSRQRLLDRQGCVIKAPIMGVLAAFLAVVPDGFGGHRGTMEACPTD